MAKFVKGQRPHPNSGRKKGVPNKIKLDLIQTLKDMGHEPAAEHIKIFREAMASYKLKTKNKNHWGAGPMLDVAARANSDLMRYCYPTKKAIEHSGPDGGPLEFKTYNDIIIALGGQVDEDDSDEENS